MTQIKTIDNFTIGNCHDYRFIILFTLTLKGVKEEINCFLIAIVSVVMAKNPYPATRN